MKSMVTARCDFRHERGRPVRRVSGLSLLEVVLALAMLALATAYMAQATFIASENAIKAQRFAKAELIAESVLAQVVAGIIPADPTTWTPYYTSYGDSQWEYQLLLVPTEVEGMIGLRVLVRESGAIAPLQGEYDLAVTRWIIDPQLGLDTPPEEGYGTEGYGGGSYGASPSGSGSTASSTSTGGSSSSGASAATPALGGFPPLGGGRGGAGRGGDGNAGGGPGGRFGGGGAGGPGGPSGRGNAGGRGGPAPGGRGGPAPGGRGGAAPGGGGGGGAPGGFAPGVFGGRGGR